MKTIRSRRFQSLWEKLNHISLIGMNYFGGASLTNSGEIQALDYMREKLKGKKNVLIFDVGANSGEYALLSHQLFGAKAVIHTFEPSDFTFQILVNNTKDRAAIIPHKIGVGSENCLLKLYSSGRGNTTSSVYNLKHKMNGFSNEFTEEIEVQTIDFFCEANGLHYIDILKLDIEGHELSAIKGAMKLIEGKSVHFIQFEFGKCDIDSKVFFRDFYDLLSPHFRLFRIVSDGLREIERYNSSLEVFHTANFLAENRDLKR